MTFSPLLPVEVRGHLSLLPVLFSPLIQMQIYCHDPDDFQSLDEAVKSGGRIAALAVLFEVGAPRLSAAIKPTKLAFNLLCNSSAWKTTRTSSRLQRPSTLSAGSVSPGIPLASRSRASLSSGQTATYSVSQPGKSGSLEAFSLRSLLPGNTDKYFLYNGSLTAPPCSETVEWVVFKQPVAISETQVRPSAHWPTSPEELAI